jgi:hypothetical protein
MSYQLQTINFEGFHFTKGSNAKVTPLPFTIPEGAVFVSHSNEDDTPTITYTTPPETEGEEPQLVEREFTEQELSDAADAIVPVFDLESAQTTKLLELAEFAKQEAQSQLTTSDGLVFHTDASTMIHVQGLKGWFAATGNEVYPNYKNADGEVNNLNEAMVDNVISEYTARLYDIYSVHFAARKQEVDAATTQQELDNITW